MKSTSFLWLLLVFIGLSVFASPLKAEKNKKIQTPEQILEQSALFTRSAKVLSFEFSLKVHYEVTDENHESKGSFLIGGKDHFRLQTPEMTMVSDGVDLWQYNPATKQVQIKSLLDLSNSLQPSEVLFRYLRCKPISSEKAKLSSHKVWHLVLDPKGQLNSLTHLEVWLDSKSYAPVQLKTVDVSGNTNEYKIENIKKNPESTDSDFEFKAPEGVEVIDMR